VLCTATDMTLGKGRDLKGRNQSLPYSFSKFLEPVSRRRRQRTLSWTVRKDGQTDHFVFTLNLQNPSSVLLFLINNKEPSDSVVTGHS